MSNNGISHSDYQRMKNNTVERTYAESFKKIRLASLLFSFFGNIASVFFAYFFFSTLFSSSIISLGHWAVSAGIIVFLSLFELLKRYIFDQFTKEVIRSKWNIFKKGRISFIISTLIIVACSYFFSVNGAQDFMNKESQIQSISDSTWEKNKEMIDAKYDKHIQALQDENNIILAQKAELNKQRATLIERKWNTNTTDKQIEDADRQLNDNKNKISLYESERDKKLEKTFADIEGKRSKQTKKNTANVLYFFLISTLIESIIMYGIFYNRNYEVRCVDEYEKKIMSTPKFQKWKKYSAVVDLIFKTEIKQGDLIPSLTTLEELVKINDQNFTMNDIENCFKVLAHIKAYDKEGNRRILRMERDEIDRLMQEHFGIN